MSQVAEFLVTKDCFIRHLYLSSTSKPWTDEKESHLLGGGKAFVFNEGIPIRFINIDKILGFSLILLLCEVKTAFCGHVISSLYSGMFGHKVCGFWLFRSPLKQDQTICHHNQLDMIFSNPNLRMIDESFCFKSTGSFSSANEQAISLKIPVGQSIIYRLGYARQPIRGRVIIMETLLKNRARADDIKLVFQLLLRNFHKFDSN